MWRNYRANHADGGIIPRHELGFELEDDEVHVNQQARHRRHFEQLRFGLKPWAVFVFYYRSQTSIQDAGCVARPDREQALDPFLGEFTFADPKETTKKRLATRVKNERLKRDSTERGDQYDGPADSFSMSQSRRSSQSGGLFVSPPPEETAPEPKKKLFGQSLGSLGRGQLALPRRRTISNRESLEKEQSETQHWQDDLADEQEMNDWQAPHDLNEDWQYNPEIDQTRHDSTVPDASQDPQIAEHSYHNTEDRSVSELDKFLSGIPDDQFNVLAISLNAPSLPAPTAQMVPPIYEQAPDDSSIAMRSRDDVQPAILSAAPSQNHTYGHDGAPEPTNAFDYSKMVSSSIMDTIETDKAAKKKGKKHRPLKKTPITEDQDSRTTSALSNFAKANAHATSSSPKTASPNYLQVPQSAGSPAPYQTLQQSRLRGTPLHNGMPTPTGTHPTMPPPPSPRLPSASPSMASTRKRSASISSRDGTPNKQARIAALKAQLAQTHAAKEGVAQKLEQERRQRQLQQEEAERRKREQEAEEDAEIQRLMAEVDAENEELKELEEQARREKEEAEGMGMEESSEEE